MRPSDDLAADTEVVGQVESMSENERMNGLTDAVQQRGGDPKFTAWVREIIEEDRELLGRLAK